MLTQSPQQLVAPLIRRFRRIKPVLFEKWMNLRLDNAAIPGSRISDWLSWCEEAVPNPKAGAEVCAICLYGLVQFTHAIDDPIDDVFGDTVRFKVRSKLSSSVERLHRDEGEALHHAERTWLVALRVLQIQGVADQPERDDGNQQEVGAGIRLHGGMAVDRAVNKSGELDPERSG